MSDEIEAAANELIEHCAYCERQGFTLAESLKLARSVATWTLARLAAEREEIRQLRDAIQDVICDPGNAGLGESTVAKLQALRGDAISPNEFAVVRRAELDELNARLAAERAEREERERPIDEAWLRSIGCKKMAVNRFKIAASIRINVWRVEHVSWRVKIDGYFVEFKTRGQLLDLLAALGAERKGGE